MKFIPSVVNSGLHTGQTSWVTYTGYSQHLGEKGTQFTIDSHSHTYTQPHTHIQNPHTHTCSFPHKSTNLRSLEASVLQALQLLLGVGINAVLLYIAL